MSKKQTNEAFFWSLFAAGGVASALFIPAIILCTGFLLPTEDPEQAAAIYDQVVGVVSNPLTKLVLIGVLFVTCFHVAHRIQHTLKDLGLRKVGTMLEMICYSAAIVGTFCAIWIILQISSPANATDEAIEDAMPETSLLMRQPFEHDEHRAMI